MRVQLAGGLVGEDDRRMAGEGPCCGDPLLLATRELARPMSQTIRQLERVDDLVEPGLVGLPARDVQRQADVLEGGQHRQ